MQNHSDWIAEQIIEHEAMLGSVKAHVGVIDQLAHKITNCLKQGGRVFFCGNGGSAADAQHWAAELSGRFFMDRPSMAGIALTVNTSEITAIGNDYGYEYVFSRPLSGLAAQGDILIGISTSGNSANVIKAFEQAKIMGVTTVGFTGQDGGGMRALSDIFLGIQGQNVARIQEGHELCAHILFGLVEKMMFAPNNF